VAPAVFTVSNTNDAGAGSLRQALVDANTAAGADTVVFDASFSTGKTITLTTSELFAFGSITITGPGAGLLTVSGNDAFRVLRANGAGADNLVISGMTITQGKTTSGFLGAGIYSEAVNLTLQNCVITNNHAWNVGGVWVSTPGKLTLTDCQVTNNKSDIHVGGVGSNGGLIVTRSTISGNTAANRAGGLYARQSLLLVDSTVSGNGAGVNGGGVEIVEFTTGGSFEIRNSTISGNTANGHGAGIVFGHYVSYPFNGTLVVQNSTITNNVAGVGYGGGIANRYGSGAVAVESTIVSGNKAAAFPDISSTKSVAMKTSAIGSAAGFTATDLGGNLAFGLDLGLGPLDDYGGPTKSHALYAYSPCANKGSNPAGLSFDQRGTPFSRSTGSSIDIGAFERQPTVVTNTNDAGPGSLRHAMFMADANGGDTVTFDASFSSPQTITLTSGEISVRRSQIVNGPGASLLTVSGNNASRILATNSPSGQSLWLQDMTLTQGKESRGGAIFVGPSDWFLLYRCTVSGNAASAHGGGIYLGASARLTAEDSTIANNTAGGDGGGVYFFLGGTMRMERCTVSGNTAGGQGGGLYFFGTVTNSYPGLQVVNCTFSGNSAGTDGGAITLPLLSGEFELWNSTLTGNKAGNGGGAISQVGGSGTLDISSAILFGNSAPTGPEILNTGAINAAVSLIGSTAGVINFTGDAFTNSNVGVDPQLGLLVDNGGPTKTHLPAAASPAVNNGFSLSFYKTDQRGPGFPRTFGGAADIGSVERPPVDFVVRNTANSGPGSLRAVIADANLAPGSQTITFDPAVFTAAQIITLTSTPLSVTEPVEIAGPGAALLTISGNNATRVFMIQAGATLTGLTIANAKTTGPGGAVNCSDGLLTIRHCIITNNSGGRGAAIYAGQGLLLTDSHLSNNTAISTGGAIEADGTVVIQRSTISGNSADLAGGLIARDSLLIEDSALTGNVSKSTSVPNGGAIFVVDQSVIPFGVAIRNSTISGNIGQKSVGGIMVGYDATFPFNGTLMIQNCTITNNSSPTGAAGGILLVGGSGSIAIESSIVSGNTGGVAADISSSSKVTVKSSAIGSSAGFTLTDLGGNLPFGLDLKLSALADHGGSTLTHALLPGSPAINVGSNPAGLLTDQRGNGFARSVGGTDMGAFENQSALAPPRVSSLVINGGAAQRSRVTQLEVTFDQPVMLPGNPADAFQLVRQSPAGAVTLSGSVAGNSVTLTFTGGTVDANSLADGRYTLTVIAAQVNGGNFDGDGNGTPGDNFVLTGTPGNGLFRIFGDNDGDGDVDAADFGAFRAAFGGTGNLAFDFDGDGDVDAADFGQFRGRFGSSV